MSEVIKVCDNPMTYVRACQKCGCTEGNACVVETGDGGMKFRGCNWVGPTHCSACFDPVDLGARCPEHRQLEPGVAAHFTLVTPDTCPICRLTPNGYRAVI